MLRHVADSQPKNMLDQPALSALLEEIRERALEFRRVRRVPQDIVEGFQHVGVYRALVATQFGGLEVSPSTFLELIETIGHADGSAGWVASFGVSATYLAALPVATLETIYAEGPDVVFAGAIFPPQAAEVSGSDFIVNGRWPYASGCPGASLIGVGIAVAGESGGLPRTAVMPASSVRIEETWNTIGLAGTGSHDVIVEGVRVPEEWTFIRGGAPMLDKPIYRYPSLGLAAQVLTVVGLGCARRALDEVIAMADGRRSITGAPTMADRAHVQAVIGEAEAMLLAARAFFFGVTDETWALLVAGQTVPEAMANRIRLAATHAAQVSSDVARMCFGLGGIAAVQTDHILGRCMQDCAVVAQHAFMAKGNYEAAGRVILGRGSRPGYP
ncbi:acyl-CoA dehydrogenase [Gluconobacter thailandicus F149-1 = NBRC 100600]|uniref:Acyl-CoA dehydrogenase n=1 Tax=Gluconobacter thailandicus NBRC 3257 TaxID=1381097 RepID=A0ABQ0J0Z4_GLUTH|nr:acyl-CoA dehydrogenase [Gluconobacter thailandicus]KXV54390.1 acyl-CoA dehydrogenase [Gluconobacter thailandicus]GAC89051.1 acyl-CoA dehydrogenase [Gluconobacter thailandicus NBRC 3255]GAD28116.1 acyl-CoA dehydrogenase [Gluconobacter thailandicus NBRC 3257]GAN94324.1 acyl-CoA dehydrogenase [Gluconobacter thailandicus F149-1 = NBRC 100600]GBR60369.1 acyl-CoA dehydrogenase [Gluconobacter thailandicus F149-1 = NBRC 100600]